MSKELQPQNKVKRDRELNLADGISIPCYVLEDGTRVLSGRAMQAALDMVDEADEGKQTPGTRLARYLDQKTLKPFIYKGKDPDHFAPIICYKGEQKIHGYEATVLVDICDGFLQARKEIKLSPRQKIIADQCEILVRSFAKVGIIALVDEATGYQYEREQMELQVIFKTLISDEILEWQRAFHLSFYKEIFRLWNIPFTPQNIRRKPSFIGHLTNSLIYKNLPKGTFVLQKLKEKTPKTDLGNWKYKLHQSLTKDQGREALKKVIYSVETLASISKDKAHFLRLMEEKYGQPELPFPNNIDALDKPKKPLSPKSDFDNKLTQALNFNPKEDKNDKGNEDDEDEADEDETKDKPQ